MACSTTDFCTSHVPVAFSFTFYRLLSNLEAIGLVTVNGVEGEGWILDFGADGFGGDSGRLSACFSTTFALFEPLVFPDVFAALESDLLEVDTFFEGGCGG